jgi:hypothetical protein
MSKGRKPGKKRGPKGGIKHQPGRSHDWKSLRAKKKRFKRKAVRKREEEEEAARKAWAEWDALSDDAKRLLGPTRRPKMPRPSNDK